MKTIVGLFDDDLDVKPHQNRNCSHLRGTPGSAGVPPASERARGPRSQEMSTYL